MTIGLLIGLMAGAILLLIQFIASTQKLNEYRDACIFDLNELKKEKQNETQRADLLAKANEDLQEEINKYQLMHSRLFQAHDSLRARIRKYGDARKYDLSVVEKVSA